MLAGMGNPSLHPSVTARLNEFSSRVAPPLTEVPPPAILPELRQCATCGLCLELVPKNTKGGLMAVCEWQGEWWFADQGCDRWRFDVTLLGDPA
jgi:hypothetical protein